MSAQYIMCQSISDTIPAEDAAIVATLIRRAIEELEKLWSSKMEHELWVQLELWNETTTFKKRQNVRGVPPLYNDTQFVLQSQQQIITRWYIIMTHFCTEVKRWRLRYEDTWGRKERINWWLVNPCITVSQGSQAAASKAYGVVELGERIE